jgi:hypothetical protein
LDLSENLLEQLDKQTFSGNDRLRILLLYGNPIKKLIADQFPVLPYLRTIDLHNCHIESISETSFSNVDLLEYLDLNQNQLQNLPGNVFNHMKNLKTLLLEDNPWNCDCKLKHFRSWYLKNNLNRIALHCKLPSNLKDQDWENVQDDAFGCAPILKIINEDVSISDLESNITFKCFTTGDPQPVITWHLDGREIDVENVIIENEIDSTNSNINNNNIMQSSSSNQPAAASSLSNVGGVSRNNNNNDNNHHHHSNSNNINDDNNKSNNNNIKIWSNLSIYNITNLNAGLYTCFAHNNLGYASQNVSLLLPEIGYEHVLIKNNETFWYFGLIVGVVGTIILFLIISLVFCVCRKVTIQRQIKKNIKNSVSFNDQEKKLLDLSITTTNDRDRDYGEISTPSSSINKANSSIISLEPVQITIENFHNSHHHNVYQYHPQCRVQEEFPLTIGIYSPEYPPPPPEFCSSPSAANNNVMIDEDSLIETIKKIPTTSSSSFNSQLLEPSFNNIYISVSLKRDTLDDNDLNMYPDLLNQIVPKRAASSSNNNSSNSFNNNNFIENSSISSSSSSSAAAAAALNASQIVPIDIQSYATLPRNKLLTKAPVSILKQSKKNYDKVVMDDCMIIDSCVSTNQFSNDKCVSCNNFKSDNMGLRVTAAGNTMTANATSQLSIPDEELENEENDSDGYRHQDGCNQSSPKSKQIHFVNNHNNSILIPNDFVSL